MSRSVFVSRCALTCLTCLAACVADSTLLGATPAARQRPMTASRAYYGAQPRPRGAAVRTQYESEAPVDSGYAMGDGGCNCDGGCDSCDSGCNGYCDGGCDSCYSDCGGGCDGGCGCGSCCSDCGGCCDGGCGSCCGSGCDCGMMGGPQKRFVIFGDYLYLRVSGADVAHAQQQDGIGGAGTAPRGDIGTVDMEHQSGFRVGGGVACSPCSSVMFSYSFFEGESFNSLPLPVITGGVGAVRSLVQHPNAVITASTGPVDATYDIDFHLADVVFTGTVDCSPRHTVDFLIGAQVGHLDQDFLQTGNFSGGQGGTIDTATVIDFDGGGLKAGFVGDRRMGGGVSGYGKVTAAVMSGQFSSRYRMFNSTTDATLAEVNWKDNRVVPQFEYEAGVAWLSGGESLRISAGYMFSHWMNAVTTSEFIDAVQADNYVDVEDTITFDGLVTRLELLW